MSNSTTNLDLLQSSQAQKEVVQNGFNDAASPAVLYGRRWNGTAGLVWHYYGGCMKLGTTFTQIANGSVTLTASSTNYIEADATTGTVTANTVGFTTGRIPLYQAVTSSSAVTSYTDSRALTYAGPAGAAITEAPVDTTAYGRKDASWARVVKVAGDTMTGPLILSGAPTAKPPGLGGGPGVQLNSNGLISAAITGAANLMFLQKDSSSGVYVYFLYGPLDSDTPSVVGSILTDGTTTIYSTTSDYRLKHDIQDLDAGLNAVLKLQPRRFKWNSNNAEDVGFIAHELQGFIPRAVTGEKDAVNEDGSIKPQGTDLSFVIPYLVKAVQELSAQVNDLTTRLEALETRP